MPASRKATSVRGSITSRSWRSPAAKTSSMSLRSSLVSDSCAATMSRSSSSVMASPCEFGSPPSSRTTTSVLLDSSQMTGRDSVAMRSSAGANGHRDALGPLQGQPLGRQLAEDQREVGDDQRDEDQRRRCRTAAAVSPAPLEQVRHRHGEPRRAEGRRQEAGQRDADLHGGQEAVGVLDRAGRPAAPRLPRSASALACPSRRLTSASSVAANTPPMRMKTRTRTRSSQGVAHGVHRPRAVARGRQGGSTPPA